MKLGFNLSLSTYRGQADSRPTATITGGTVTTFTRDNVSYTQIEFTTTGSVVLSGPLNNVYYALGGGGGAGGRVSSVTYIPGAGGAGELVEFVNGTIPQGTYNVTIGAGAPAVTTVNGQANGSASTLEVVGVGIIPAVGGGFGATSGTGMVDGSPGGSGGGGRGGPTETTGNAGASIAVAGIGNAGGTGNGSATTALRASGAGGGAGGPGGSATSGVPGVAGLGKLLDWVEPPRTVCAGGSGILAVSEATADMTYGSGSTGAVNQRVGAGGNGFFFLRVKSDDVRIIT